LIVHGDSDQEVPISQSQKLAKLIPQSDLKVVHGADHWYTHEDHTEQMLKIITEFFIGQA